MLGKRCTIHLVTAQIVPILLCSALMFAGNCRAQAPALAATESATPPVIVVPQTVRFSAQAEDRAGDTVEAVFRIYAGQNGGEPLWSETQAVHFGADGSFSVLLGAATEGGLPQGVFVQGQARWVGVSIERGEEQPRTLLASVPYAMKAADAETLGGLAPGNFVTRQQLAAAAESLAAQAAERILPEATLAGGGTTNYVPLWTGAATLGSSAILQSGTSAAPLIGIGVSAPGVTLDIGGGAAFRDELLLLPASLATQSQGVDSPPLSLVANTFSSQLGQSIRQTFSWQTTFGTNDVTAPTGSLQLLYAQGHSVLHPTGLSVATDGVVTFAPTQRFPGTITAVTAVGPVTASTVGSGAISVGLDLPQLQSTLNQAYSQLGAANTFAGNQTVKGSLTVNSQIVALGGLAKPVGIGTTSPAYDLEVASSNANRAQIAMVSYGTDAAISVNNAASGGREYWIDSGSGSAFIGAGNFSIYDKTAGIPRFVINRFGQVGVGTTSPNYAFHVFSPGASTAQLAMVSNGTDAAISLNNNAIAGHEYWLDSGSPGSGIGAGNFAIYDKTWGLTRMVITSGGRLGLGTTAPAYGLEVNQPNAVTAQMAMVTNGTDAAISVNNTAAGGREYWIDSGSGMAGVGAGNFAVYDRTAGSTRLVINSSGEVGIGTTAPATTLDVRGSLNVLAGAVAPVARFTNSSTALPTVLIQNSAGKGEGTVAAIDGSATHGCFMDTSGDLTCTGALKGNASVVPLGVPRQVETYALQSTENWIEDFGSAELRGGTATVTLDPVFAQTVNTEMAYHVYLTPNGDTKGLYVTEKQPGSFVVRETGGGQSSIAFDYRIVARRRGYETGRLVDVTEQNRRRREAILDQTTKPGAKN